MGLEDAEVLSHSDYLAPTALAGDDNGDRSGLLGQVQQHAGPGGRGARLFAEGSLSGPSHRGILGPLVGGPADECRDQLVTPAALLHDGPR